MPHKNNLENLEKFIEIIAKLRSPEGCPWDREQTHSSLREHMLEEAYEAVEAIELDKDEDLKEELGDVLLQVVLHSQIASEEKRFSIDDVAKTISEKIIRRHPHVFGDVKVKGSEEVLVNWDKIKKDEKPERKSALSGVAKCQPGLMSASELSKKAVKVGFEWPNIQSLWDCLQSEIEEFKDATISGNKDEMEDELGDILFSIVNVARWHGINAELAMLRANKKFTQRFQMMEQLAPNNLSEYPIEELEELWQTAKHELSKKK